MTRPRTPAAGSVGRALAPSSALASVGGVGGGTGLVALAEAIGPGTKLGSMLLYLAPSISVGVGGTLYFLEAQVNRYFEQRLVKNAHQTLERQLDNPRTSYEHKAKIRELLEELDLTEARTELERVRGLPAQMPAARTVRR